MAATRKTAPKAASGESTAAKASAKAAKTAEVPATAPAESEAEPAKTLRVKGPTLKLKELVDRVAETSGAKKKDVKAIVEATLTALGDGLDKGEELNLPGLGRARVARSAEKDGASMLTLKVRRGTHQKKDAKEPLADDEDDG